MQIVDETNFKKEVLESKIPVMVDFFAVWCPPCKILEPIVKDVAAAVGDKAIIAHLDIDDSRETANRYGVLSVPTLVLFKGGKEQVRMVGVQQKATILAKINELLGQ